MAGAEGLEPSTKVLETHVLPLHHAPTFFRTKFIIPHFQKYVNSKLAVEQEFLFDCILEKLSLFTAETQRHEFRL